MTESITKDMRYNVDEFSPKEDILHCIPELTSIKSFKMYPGTHGGQLNRDHVIRYILLLYSDDTILNQRPPLSLKERKEKAATIAGFKMNKKGWNDKIVNKLFEFNCDFILNMITDFLILQKNYVWTEICTIEQTLDEFVRIRMKALDTDESGFLKDASQKTKLAADCKMMIKELDDYYREFYKNHEEDTQKLKRKRVRIEDIAIQS